MLLLTLLFACSDPPEATNDPTPEPAEPAQVEAPDAPAMEEAPEAPVTETTGVMTGEEGEITPATPEPTAENPSADPSSAPEPASEATTAQDAAAPEQPTPDPEPEVADATEEPATEEDPVQEEVPPEPAGPFSYSLTPKGSSIYVQVFKDTSTAASGLSHDHVMSASGWSGSASWDPANPGACRLDVSVPVSKLVVDSPKMRSAVGYDSELSESQRKEVKSNMLSKGQLNGDKYKTVSFSATRCKVNGSKVDVTGDFTLKGTTKTITVPMTLEADADGFSAKGSFKVKGSDYGLEPYTAMLGALKNQDTVKITVRVVGS